MVKMPSLQASVPFNRSLPMPLSQELNRAFPIQAPAFEQLLEAIDQADSGWRETQHPGA
jgi:hypothetical protein